MLTRLVRRLASLILIAAATCLGSCVTVAADPGTASPMRAAFEARYQDLVRAHALAPGNLQGNDVSDVAAAFFKPGMAFKDALEVLERNGFVVSPPPPRMATGQSNIDRGRFNIYAGLLIQKQLMGRTDVSIEIYPVNELEGQPMLVGSIRAKITTTTP